MCLKVQKEIKNRFFIKGHFFSNTKGVKEVALASLQLAKQNEKSFSGKLLEYVDELFTLEHMMIYLDSYVSRILSASPTCR